MMKLEPWIQGMLLQIFECHDVSWEYPLMQLHALLNLFMFIQTTMPRRKAGEEMNFTYVECLLYAFHHLAHKVNK